jgi:hypothetical protein
VDRYSPEQRRGVDSYVPGERDSYVPAQKRSVDEEEGRGVEKRKRKSEEGDISEGEIR